MKWVMASGHFDPLHPGHINYLLAAKELGDFLVVAVDSDEALRKKHSPILTGPDRVELVRSLDFVDVVRLSNGPDVSDLIEEIQPAVYAVGPDHSIENVSEKPACDRVGTKIVVLDRLSKELPSSAIAKAKMCYSNQPFVVNGLIVDGGSILLGERNDGSNLLELVGGFVERGETLEQALIREMKEEISVAPTSLAYLGSYPGKYSDGRALLSAVFQVNVPLWKVKSTTEISVLRRIRVCPSAERFFAECDYLAVKDYFERSL